MSHFQAPRWKSLALLAALVAVLCVPCQTVSAEDRDERAVRVAYLYNLIKYIDWPAPQSDLFIGYVGSRSTGEVLFRSLDGRKSDARTIHVILSPHEDALERCGVLYFGDASPEEIQKTLAKLGGRPVLTLGETPSFPRQGGMIGLVKAEDHIQIVVNLSLTQSSGIKISSRVLNLATIVRTDGRG